MQNLVKEYLTNLQNEICNAFELEDGQAKFFHDDWRDANVITGDTRVIKGGSFIEQAAVNFSHVRGSKLPGSASARYPELAGTSFEAMGLSLIVHPLNPYVPTTHANVRFFMTQSKTVWWFGGGYDLTPYYPFVQDCEHWHAVAHKACAPFGKDVYPRFKQWCDEYFYLPHRQETRGIGGLFFDDLNLWPFEQCFAFMRAVGDSFLSAYLPIVRRRKNINYGERERDFQLYRRGRYVEFNLLYDRGTLFGLQAKGRTESILASLPPQVRWRYNWQPAENSAEAELNAYLRPREWLCKNAVHSSAGSGLAK